MKKISGLLMVIMAAIALCGNALANDGNAIASFAEETFDFGIINEKDGPVSHDFEFINSGNANLIIVDATAQCGCTRPEFSKKPMAPGSKSKVKVTYNPKGRPGAFSKTVTVRTNGRPAKVRLKITGTVNPAK